MSSLDCRVPRAVPAALRVASRLAVRSAVRGAALVASLAAACGPGTAVSADVERHWISDTPWEAAFEPSEMTETIVGRTFRATGAPFGGERYVTHPGAAVELLVPRPDGRAPLTKVAEATSGPDGMFSVGKAPVGAWALRTRVDGLLGMLAGEGLRMRGAVLIEPGGERRCGLSEIRRLTGHVTDGRGAPVGGAQIEAAALGYLTASVTAPDGSFAFDVPAPGCVVSLMDPQWEVVRETVSAPGTAPVALRTARVDTLGGFVATCEDGRPVSGAVVVWLDDPTQHTRTGEDGRFSLPIPRTGRIAAFGAGRAWKSYGLLRVGEQEIRLPAAESVRGRVLDEEGRPLADARILGVTTNRSGAPERVFGPKTGPDGSFDASWMPRPLRGSKRPTAILAWHRLHGASAAVPLPAAGPVELRIGGRRKVEVSLADGSGRPVPCARVIAEWSVAGLSADEASVLGIPLLRAAPTAADGTTALDGIAAGVPVQVKAHAWGIELSRDLAAGRAAEKVELKLPLGRVLAGKLADRNGKPPGARGSVEARLLDQPGLAVRRRAETGPDGAFRLEDLPPGRYELIATAEGWDLPAGAEAQAGAEEVSILIERSARIGVRLHFDGDPQAAGREAVRIRLEDPADKDAPQKNVTSPPGDDGRLAALGGVRPGEWRVLAEAGAWRGAIGPVTVGDGEEKVLDLHLERTEFLRGTVRTHDGTAVPGAPIVARPLAGAKGAVQSFQSGDGGAVESAGFAAGRWELRVNPVGLAPLVTTVELPAAAPLELRLPPCGDLVCRLADEEDAGSAGVAFVSLLDAAGNPVFAWPEDGSQMRARFRFDEGGRTLRVLGIPAGKLRVELTLGGKRRPVKEIDVRPGEAVELPL